MAVLQFAQRRSRSRAALWHRPHLNSIDWNTAFASHDLADNDDSLPFGKMPCFDQSRERLADILVGISGTEGNVIGRNRPIESQRICDGFLFANRKNWRKVRPHPGRVAGHISIESEDD